MAPQELSFRYDPSSKDSASSFLYAYKGKQRVGELLFGLEGDGTWQIGNFVSHEAGVGKALIAELRDYLPGYALITSEVTEPETLQKLRELREFALAESKFGEMVLTEEDSIDVLAQLKIYRVLHGGGLTDISIILLNTGEPVDSLAKNPTNVSVRVEARTP